ncbi:MAG TPA: cytochrome C [Blastocatellia bacterium]
MKHTHWMKLIVIAVLFSAGAVFYQGVNAQQRQEPKHPPVPTDGNEMVVQLCDGETSTKVKGVPPDGRLTPEQAQAVSNELMRMWLGKVDPARAEAWMKEEAAAQAAQSKAKAPAKKPQTTAKTGEEEQQPNDFTDRDFSIWKRELDREIKYGNEIFHSDKLIGSANGVACAMCHPNAANTHPETYPKFQIQLRRVALLRDMINWCIEQPARGKKLDPDDPKMRALEAYIMSQRKGVPMEFGKH